MITTEMTVCVCFFLAVVWCTSTYKTKKKSQ